MTITSYNFITELAHEFFYEDGAIGCNTPIDIIAEIVKYGQNSMTIPEFCSVIEVAVWNSYRVDIKRDFISGYEDIDADINISEEYYQTVYQLTNEILTQEYGYVPYFIGWIGHMAVFTAI